MPRGSIPAHWIYAKAWMGLATNAHPLFGNYLAHRPILISGLANPDLRSA